MTNVGIIIPYFGKWPPWFNFFLKSCEPNKNFNWIFYTDCGVPKWYPENVTFIEITFNEYKKKVSESLNINFNPESAYKICDLRPAFGHIHKKDIEEYDFYGYGDIDVIYGNLNIFFTEEKFKKFNILSSHYRRLCGHLCLFKNTEEVRSIYLQIKNWKTQMEDKQHRSVDEKAFSDLFVHHKNLPPFIRKFTNKFYKLAKTVSFEEAYSTPNAKLLWHDGTKVYPEVWHYNKGHLTNSKDGAREFAYLHFMSWKQNNWDKLESIVSNINPLLSDSWHISSSGFHK